MNLLAGADGQIDVLAHAFTTTPQGGLGVDHPLPRLSYMSQT